MSERQTGSGSGGGKSSNTPPIVIASKDANRRSDGTADPGPGDMEAAPSEMPQPVDIPDPPTASQLVVKSTVVGSSRGAPSSTSNMDLGLGSATGPAASQPSVQAAREPTSSRPLTGPGPSGRASEGASSRSARTGGGVGGGSASAAGGSSAGHPPGSTSAPRSATGSEAAGATAAGSQSPAGSMAGSEAGGSPDGRSHHEDEVGEGEVEHDGQESSPAAHTPPPSSGGQHAAASASSRKEQKSSIMSSQAAQAFRQGQSGSGAAAAGSKSGKPGDKKVTRFRYHKRITVRTSGKNNPQAIMNKVNKGVSPSTIGEIDASDLMKRVGIKNTKHWRIRVRQTKRITKNGKTTTQTKTAYRDSSGNLQPPPGTCKKCAKKQSDCKCGSSTSHGSTR